ncbi:Glycosyl hydrolase family 10 protein [Abeliophyllum distichum]|uniref:Glycosyl hydrolase family 10 protein n=1 Tax=Abeliophyllum distichum TaxID=126358 RepID=A0ABD1P8N5_9LAMI
MQYLPFFCPLLLLLFLGSSLVLSYDGPLYDSSAYRECKLLPEEPLYNGGILKDQDPNLLRSILDNGDQVSYPTFLLQNLTQGNKYCFSVWIKINNADSALVRASLVTEETTLSCIGTVIAKQGCWSFLKGGFVLTSSPKLSELNLQDSAGRDIDIEIASASLQPFTEEQWSLNQQTKINKARKRAVIIHVSDRHGAKLQGAAITVEQVSKDFPFGSAIAKTIIGNSRYQKWFTERFNAAVFENELKWDATEPTPGQVNYTIPDQMLKFVRANQIITRGHNIFWENPKSSPKWILNLTSPDLQSAVTSRIQSLMSRYKEEFIHWDVSNEMLHFDFYEQKLGPNATLQFFTKAHQIDPLATLFMNEYNVVETCNDDNSTVDTYISRMIELKQGGVTMDGIGLQGHFDVPNPPLMRAILDKLATLGLPIWLTEVDISKQFSKESQAIYLEEVLREGFSHPAVNGMILWTAIRQNSCYQMCLTDNDFNNLPAGDTVDKLLKEWQTGILEGKTNEHGSYSFHGFLGEYKVTAKYDNKTVISTFSCKSLPEAPLYNGGSIKNQTQQIHNNLSLSRTAVKSPAFVLYNLTGNTMYSFSSWITINGTDSAVIKASLTTDNNTFNCMGTVSAKLGCWSFLKGGFVMESPSNYALIYFQNLDGGQINITVSSASLQPFTDQQWRINQQLLIETERKRMATLHVSDVDGNRLQGATIVVEQVSRDFPFGSAIAQTILGNLPYQNWFFERFNAAVFEDELKWYSTEPQPGIVNYTTPDQMLEFVRRNQIIARGHNIFWENPNFTPSWVRNLTGPELQTAVKFRIQSLMNHYKNEFIHWDVDNEMLHYNFYEQRLGPNASLQFFETAQKSDPLARLFMNEFNVLETCDDRNSTVDAYISRLGELGKGGVSMDGIGLEGHFTVPNPPLIRAVLDKLATLGLPIWLTEVDISKSLDQETQARYLEAVLREGFSHPSINGIMLWTALHPYGCYQMCLTDNNFQNLPAGNVVDTLLKEWQTGAVEGQTDDHGSFSFDGFLGEYNVTVNYGNRTANSSFTLCRDDETKHWNIQLQS